MILSILAGNSIPNKFLIKRSKPLDLNAALSLLSIQLQVKDCGQYTVCMYEDLLLLLLLLLVELPDNTDIPGGPHCIGMVSK